MNPNNALKIEVSIVSVKYRFFSKENLEKSITLSPESF